MSHPIISITDLTPRDQLIIALWKEGRVFNEIVAHVGHGLTRNAVAGVIHRARQRGWIGQRAQDEPYKEKFGRGRNQVRVSTSAKTSEIKTDQDEPRDLKTPVSSPIYIGPDTAPVSAPPVSAPHRGASKLDAIDVQPEGPPPSRRSPPPTQEIHVVTDLTDQSEASTFSERYLPATKQLGKPVSILTMGPLHCRWVLDERDDEANLPLYCGCRRVTGLPYCLPHAKRASNQPIKRQGT